MEQKALIVRLTRDPGPRILIGEQPPWFASYTRLQLQQLIYAQPEMFHGRELLFESSCDFPHDHGFPLGFCVRTFMRDKLEKAMKGK